MKSAKAPTRSGHGASTAGHRQRSTNAPSQAWRDGRRSAQAEIPAKARRPALAPGSFTLFKGDLSLHRVSEIEGEHRRIIALFSYDRRPDQVFEQSYIEELRARRAVAAAG